VPGLDDDVSAGARGNPPKIIANLATRSGEHVAIVFAACVDVPAECLDDNATSSNGSNISAANLTSPPAVKVIDPLAVSIPLPLGPPELLGSRIEPKPGTNPLVSKWNPA
jgi:hypothetical protein